MRGRPPSSNCTGGDDGGGDDIGIDTDDTIDIDYRLLIDGEGEEEEEEEGEEEEVVTTVPSPSPYHSYTRQQTDYGSRGLELTTSSGRGPHC